MSDDLEQDDVSDGELLYRLSHGNERAYRDLFRRHQTVTYRVALLMVRTPQDAEEVVGSAFLELWRKRESVRLVDNSVRPWLLATVTFAAKNQLRGMRRYQRLLRKIPDWGNTPDHADEIARVLDGINMASDVRTALSELSADYAAVLLLCVVQELTIRSTAQALGIPEGTVKSRLSRAKAQLRHRLQTKAQFHGEAAQ